jgi:hypothetical protein
VKNLGVTSPIFRLFAVGFGFFFASFAVVAWARQSDHDNMLSLTVLLIMVAAGVWIVSIGVVGVPVAAGRYVGGGPLLPRVTLMPGSQSPP